jgi:hypothetical protein
MYLENFLRQITDFAHGNPLTTGAAVLVPMVLLATIFYLRRIKRTEAEDRKAKTELDREQKHLNGLSPLITDDLLEVPSSFNLELLGNQEAATAAGTFKIRGTHVFVCKRESLQWFLGPVTDRVLRGLRDGEYVSENHILPLAGQGEKHAWRTLRLDRQEVVVYPRWLKDADNTAELRTWAQLQANFKHTFGGAGRNYQMAVQAALPQDRLDRLKERRRHCAELRARVERSYPPIIA